MSATNPNQPRRLLFALGRVVATRGAMSALKSSGEDAIQFLIRHATGDWGDICEEDKRLNDDATAHEGNLERQSRVLSAFRTKSDERIWVVTEADRSSTCVLLPEEY